MGQRDKANLNPARELGDGKANGPPARWKPRSHCRHSHLSAALCGDRHAPSRSDPPAFPCRAGGRGGAGPDLQEIDVFKLLTPDDKLATYGIDDPLVDGVACHFTVPERGGVAGALGIAEEVSDISLACRQVGPITFKGKFAQGDVVFSERRSIFFKKMQIVRGCDVKRNVLVYVVYSDKLIDGSPKNSTSTVPIMPWGTAEAPPKCADWLE